MAKRKSEKKDIEVPVITLSNIWDLSEIQIIESWEYLLQNEDFPAIEEKLLNIIRMAFEVVHYNPEVEREKDLYENGEWALISRSDENKGKVAFRKRIIKSLNDLTYDNVKHITAAEVLQLIANNFGGGWDSISLSVRDIIESGFDITTTTLPSARLHIAGGTWERKLADGCEGIEVVKGTWVEAIFAKKKAPMLKLRFATDASYDEEGNRVDPKDLDNDADEIKDDYEREQQEAVEEDSESQSNEDDETFYSSYSPEANVKVEDDEDTEGLSVME